MANEGCPRTHATECHDPAMGDDCSRCAIAARDAAIETVTRGAPAAWLAAAAKLIRDMPRETLFTTDDLWAKLAHPPEPRAMGAVVKHASTTGLITATGRYVRSARAACHARPVAVWERL